MDLRRFNELLAGWNVMSQEGFDRLTIMREKTEWSSEEKEDIRFMVHDGLGNALTELFNNSPSFKVYKNLFSQGVQFGQPSDMELVRQLIVLSHAYQNMKV